MMYTIPRDFLKDSIRKNTDFSNTPQNRGVAPPPPEKPAPPDAEIIPLIPPEEWRSISATDVQSAIAQRKSRRKYSQEPLTREELSFLLWATQGIRPDVAPHRNFRTVPSAGCRHAFETYIAALRVEDLAVGIYRYLPLSHALCAERQVDELPLRLARAALGQPFCGTAAATFIWTAIPYRMEWRYAEASYKVIALDAGHVCQNLYLACECINAGTCAIAAYDQEEMDNLLDIDGEDECTVYLAPVGKITSTATGVS